MTDTPFQDREGHCALPGCGQLLVITADDCWHPNTVKRACPCKNGIRPGRENFREGLPAVIPPRAPVPGTGYILFRSPVCGFCSEELRHEDAWICDPCGLTWDEAASDGETGEWSDPDAAQCPSEYKPWAHAIPANEGNEGRDPHHTARCILHQDHTTEPAAEDTRYRRPHTNGIFNWSDWMTSPDYQPGTYPPIPKASTPWSG